MGTALAPQTKLKMPARKGGTFAPPPAPAFRVFVKLPASDLEFSARDKSEAARIAGNYCEDYAVKVVPLGTDPASVDWIVA